MSTIGNVTLMGPTSNTSTTTNAASQTLTQADFLQLMVAQFTQQDPLASSGDGGGDSGTSSYITQLMGMTNLTTLQNVSAQQGLQLANSLQGSTVTLNANNQIISGVVQNTSVDPSGGIDVTVNGTTYPSSDVTTITQTPAQIAATAAAAATTAASSGATGTSGTTSN